MSTIELENIGAVERLVIPVPENGGLVVLKADNGKGKSTTLTAIESAITGRGQLSVRDRAVRGQVEAFGVTITVGRNTRRKGELVVNSLDGKLSIGELIDPGLKSPEAADARRIKALLALVGAKPDASLFHRLFGGQAEFDQVVSAAALKCDDLIAMADRIKRDAEAKARAEEDAAEKAEGRALGAKAAAGEVDPATECDSNALQAQLEAAIRHESSLQSRLEAAEDATAIVELARQSIEEASAAFSGMSVADAAATEAAKKTAVTDAESEVRSIESALQRAKQKLIAAKGDLETATAQRKAAEEHEATMAQWRKQVAASVPEKPSQDELDAASDAVYAARQAVERGALIRQAKKHLEEHSKAIAEASAHRARAERLRDAAKGTDEVLSELVGRLGTPLRVDAGRLVTETSRGDTFFHELSDGERARMAIDIGIDAAGPESCIVFPQQQFEGLSPRNRMKVAEHAKARGAVIITALATDDEELVAEVI